MLGERIRTLRKENKITLLELAQKSDLSASYLSQVERNLAEPSLSALRKIACALEVQIYSLMEDITTDESSKVAYRNKLTIPKDSQIFLRRPKSSLEYRLVSPLPSEQFMPNSLLLGFMMKPHSQDALTPFVHAFEEIVMLSEGTMNVIVSDTVINLEAGDTTLISKNLPHQFINETDNPVFGYLVYTPASDAWPFFTS